MKKSQLLAKVTELLESGAVVVTGADIKDGVAERIQVYFGAEGEAVMDIISKDDLVQNWPDSGVYTLNTNAKNGDSAFRQVEMFEGEEDMYFRIDGTHEEADDFGQLPTVLFLETVEAICRLK